jgi:hypothetical protein
MYSWRYFVSLLCFNNNYNDNDNVCYYVLRCVVMCNHVVGCYESIDCFIGSRCVIVFYIVVAVVVVVVVVVAVQLVRVTSFKQLMTPCPSSYCFVSCAVSQWYLMLLVYVSHCC